MNHDKLISFLTGSGLVSHLSAKTIAGNFTQRRLAKNSFLLKEGNYSNEYFFIETGFIRAFALNTEGDEITTGFYAEGQVVFEVSSFFNRIVSKENIQALTDCTGCSISYLQLNSLFHAMPEFREFGRSILVKGFSGLKNRMLSMITDTAEERYTWLLHNNPEIFKHAALKHIASYLGITDSSLSRIRKEFSKK